MKLRILDISAIVLSLLVIGGFSVSAYSGRTASRDVVIESSETRWIHPLAASLAQTGTARRGLPALIATVLLDWAVYAAALVHPRPFWGA